MPFPPANDKNEKKPSGLKDAAKKVVGAASAEGKTKPIEDFLKNEGLNYDLSDFMLAASKNPTTGGKSPEEIVQILMDEPDVLEDILSELDAQGGNPEEEEEVKEPGEYDGMDANSALDKMAEKASKSKSEDSDF